MRLGIATLSLLCAVGLALEAGATTRSQESGSQDSAALLSQLEAKSDRIRIRLAGPKLGGVQRNELRDQLREIDVVSEQIRAGRTPEAERVARLLDRPYDPDAGTPAALAERLASRQEALDRRLAHAPKLNALQRDRMESELTQLDRVIAALEDGSPEQIARAEALLGIERPRTLAERRVALEIRKASLERHLGSGLKRGALRRERMRQEIEALDAIIDELESTR